MKLPNILSLGLTAFAVLGLATQKSASAASLIDFETLPDGTTPSKGLAISNQFEESHGIIFSLEGGGLPVLAKVGEGNPGAFSDNNNKINQPALGQDIGQLFLTDDFGSGRPNPLLITYTNPVSEAYGELLLSARVCCSTQPLYWP